MDVASIDLGGDHEQGDRVGLGVGHRRDEVGCPRAGCSGEDNSRAPSRQGIAGSHVRRALFVAGGHHLRAAQPAHLVVRREEMASRDGEHGVHAGRDDGLGDRAASLHLTVGSHGLPGVGGRESYTRYSIGFVAGTSCARLPVPIDWWRTAADGPVTP